jgi:2-(1,2-epoxy-1,2-dihydrophenyl)acetyl-CoA isomerase
MSDDLDGVAVHLEKGVARITISHQHRRNALTADDRWALTEALRSADENPSCTAIVVTGAGEHFCSGADIREFTVRRDRASAETYALTAAQTVFRTLRTLSTPVIARVRGVAAGAGMFLALGCDIVVADESASFFAAHLRLGVAPDWGAIWLMPRLVGLPRAKALLLTGGSIDATEAAHCGLIAECTPIDRLDERVDWYCGRIASFPPGVVAATRLGLDRSLDTPMDDFLAWEASVIADAMSSDEHADRVAAFLAGQRNIGGSAAQAQA